MHQTLRVVLTLFLFSKVLLAQTPKFSKPDSIGSVGYGFGLSTDDLDGDGKKDDIIVSDVGTRSEEPTINWYRFNGKIFEKSVIYIGRGILRNAWLEFNYVQDLNNDGYKDVIVVSNDNPRTVLWLKNPGKNNWGVQWESLPITHSLDSKLFTNEPTLKPYVATTVRNPVDSNYYDVLVGPAGDVIDASKALTRATDIQWFTNPLGDYSKPWKVQNLGFSFCSRISMLQPLWSSNKTEVAFFITASSEDYSYELSNKTGKWSSQFVDRTIRSPSHGSLANIDGDDDLDVVAAAGYRFNDINKPQNNCRQESDRANFENTNLIVWYEKTKEGWSAPQIIKKDFYYAFSATSGKLRASSKFDDVVIANADSRRNQSGLETPNSEVMICQNPKSTNDSGAEWKCYSIEQNLPAVSFLSINDIDDDGHNDIVALAVGLRDGKGNSIHPGKVLFFKNLEK